jgi:hypothetical protein
MNSNFFAYSIKAGDIDAFLSIRLPQENKFPENKK